MIKTYKYGEVAESEIFSRVVPEVDVAAIVADIIANVRSNGDSAVLSYCEKFDKAKLDSLEVTAEEIDEAYDSVEDEFKDIMKKAAQNIYAFHSKQVRESFVMDGGDGVVMGQKVMPIERVGLYVPGGTAAYPSSVLMNCIPAKIAGCSEIVMVTPPSADGKINPAILAAAKIAGVDRIFKIGGAQAVAALAYGTESVPKVDKIVGPGNAFVAEAKKQVFGVVAIDMIAGPSEIMIVADGTCDAEVVATDLLSQAEHDKMASAVLVTDDMDFAKAVSDELERQIPLLPRNEIAPEHLELCVDNPFDYLDSIKHAGSIFMGKYCPEALGDYFAGPNHTLPTSGTARFSSPLSVDDFVKKTQYTYYTKDALSKVADDIAYFAEKEGLSAHAKSATIRFEDEN